MTNRTHEHGGAAGSSGALRKAAAAQIAQLSVTAENESLFAILNKLQYCMVSTSWETRTAAGHALGSIAQLTAGAAFNLQQEVAVKSLLQTNLLEEAVAKRLSDEQHQGALSFDSLMLFLFRI